MTNYRELHSQYEFDVYPKRDVCFVEGQGARLWDDAGKEYIDCGAGIGVANIGHANDYLVDAICKQSQKLITCPGAFYNDTRGLLLQKLISITAPGLTRAFLCNSGTEGVEAAIKFARFTTGKTSFVCAMKSFHGRTLGALSATFRKEYKKEFEPLVPGFTHVPLNNFEKLTEAVNENTAGIILELVQGEGGINITDKEYISKVRAFCKEKNILLIIDEIQTGFCRTGKMFAYEHYDIEPDILIIAKGMAGGFPMGAVICSDKIQIPIGRHGSTFGGNPLACAASIAAINFMLDNDLAQQAYDKGKYFAQKLEAVELSKVRSIRRLGMMIGIELKEKVKPYLEKLLEEGIVALPAGTTVLRLLPPLVISYNDLDTATDKLIALLK